MNSLSKGLNRLFESTLYPQENPQSELRIRSVFVIIIEITIRIERQRQATPRAILKGVTNFRILDIKRHEI